MGGRGGTGRRSGLKIRFPMWSAGSSPAVRTSLILCSALALVACGKRDDPNRTDVTVIGTMPRSADPDAGPLDTGRAILANETAMGLVTLDATGQIEPALAESWIVTDDGLSIIFRIRRLNWPDGTEVTGDHVAESLNKAIADNSRNRLKPLLGAIDTVVGMTGRVVEIRLKVPRPYLLQLLAQPELGIRRRGFGLGPWRIAQRHTGQLILRPAPDPALVTEEDAPKDERRIHLSGARAALAIAKFQAGDADLVLGGTLADWPLIQAARLSEPAVRVDPAEGLFGLAVVSRTDFLKQASTRIALAMAIDRVELVSAFGAQRWKAMDRILPAQLDSGQPAASPDWVNNSLGERRAIAAGAVAAYVRANGAVVPLRVALPAGPGMRQLFNRLSRDWASIGVPVILVPFAAPDADLRLIDEVAPNTSANWYLTRTGCEAGLPCSEAGDSALKFSRTAASLGERSAALALADRSYVDVQGYIPIAKPLRWSLVASKLTGFHDNAFAAHPLMHVRPEPANN